MTSSTASAPRLWVDDTNSGSPPGMFVGTLAIACLLHLVLLLGLSFERPEKTAEKHASRALEIVVLRQAASTEKEPEIANALAQVNRVGGGVEEVQSSQIEPSVEPTPEIMEPDPLEAASLPPPPVPKVVQPPKPQLSAPIPDEMLTATIDPEPTKTEPLELPEPEPEPEIVTEPEPVPPPVTAAQILASRNLEIAELASRIQHSSAAYANRPRRRAINASTREYKYASYLEAWRRKVERVGNLNYPEEAKRHKMYGNLILHVAVRADGSIERVRVLRSSGYEVLDEAAVKIVELAAPFAPFSPDIRKETDILDITRTWQFLSNNRLGWKN